MPDTGQDSRDAEKQQSRSSDRTSKAERRMSRAERRMSRAISVAHDPNLDEYEKLAKYVSVYREPGKGDVIDEEGEMKRLWYAPWKKRWVPAKAAIDAGQHFPDEWLITDIKQGLTEAEANNRRRRSGWNELISQKENPIEKFISYFQGPILYGMIMKLFTRSFRY